MAARGVGGLPCNLWRVVAAVVLGTLVGAEHGAAQTFGSSGGTGSFFSGGFQPFVTGWIPIIGPNGVVGGVKIDAEGAVNRAALDEMGALQRARQQAIVVAGGAVHQPSRLRKISLARLEKEIQRRAAEEIPLTDEIEFLAGLLRIQYVLVYPEQNDIVLAGPAEGWRVDGQGNVVGNRSAQPVVQLADLVVVIRSARAVCGEGVSCSIDPDQHGLEKLRELIEQHPAFSEATLRQMEQSLGLQNVVIHGVEPDTHFARVMVAADVLMKRLAMHLEDSPIPQLSSYLELLEQSSSSVAQNMMPRWWLATDYDSLLRDEEGLAWQLRGNGVQVLTENQVIREGGRREGTGRSSVTARRWATRFTKEYDALSQQLPVFQQLRNCMDLCVVVALLTRHDVIQRSGFQSSVLADPAVLEVARFHTPKTVASQASFVAKGNDWIVCISGGVEIDAAAVVEQPRITQTLASVRQDHQATDGDCWWWD